VLEGPIDRIDATSCVLMTRDERLIEFDTLTVLHDARKPGEATHY
jgi:hypothetical protein